MRTTNRKVWAVSFLVFLLVGPLLAASENVSRTITVFGEGTAVATPDVAVLTIDVQQDRDAIDDATVAVKKKIDSVLVKVKSFSIADADIQTVRYSAGPKYESKNGDKKAVGFVVVDTIRVTLRDTTKLGQLTAVLAGSDLSRLDGPRYEISNPAQVQAVALKNAIEDAQSKAKVAAEAVGATLGPVYSVEVIHGNPEAKETVSATPVVCAEEADSFNSRVKIVYSLR